jgi:hypothetical protein
MSIDYLQRRDSDGVIHHIDVQDQPQSCVLASIGMLMRQLHHYRSTKLPDTMTDEMVALYSIQFRGSLLAF